MNTTQCPTLFISLNNILRPPTSTLAKLHSLFLAKCHLDNHICLPELSKKLTDPSKPSSKRKTPHPQPPCTKHPKHFLCPGLSHDIKHLQSQLTQYPTRKHYQTPPKPNKNLNSTDNSTTTTNLCSCYTQKTQKAPKNTYQKQRSFMYQDRPRQTKTVTHTHHTYIDEHRRNKNKFG